ncbi:MAG: sulfatase-like hydrolase/transferase, partial [Chloroflexota bacterium]|nr:sulfatase-like hydrolase/transferase [Chloroflexota bacterium]
MDAMIGQILDALEANGLAENTLVIYTSDHGDQVGEHGLWFKQTFYEGSLRVPAILSWPGVLPAGTRFAQAASTVDVVATMVDALGAPPLPQGRGDSLLPALRGEDTAWKDFALAEYAPHGRFQRMVRRGPWKLNYYQGEPTQLFNLVNDPHETTDLAGDPQYRHIQEQLLPEVHVDWNPDRIARRLKQKAADLELMTQWTRHVRPPEPYHWPLTGEMNWLDDYDGPDKDTRTFADPL